MGTFLRRQRALIVVVGSLISLGLAVFFIDNDPEELGPPRSVQSAATPLPAKNVVVSEPAPIRSGLPVRLKIPTIKADAAVEEVGLTSMGAMDVPKSPNDVAWFNLGPRPGEQGNAVMAGHFDWYDGKTAVFFQLRQLRLGDQLSIEDDQGKILTFVVRQSRWYTTGTDALEVFASASGRHLNLVTCGGAWNITNKIYTKRLVVFTDLVE